MRGHSGEPRCAAEAHPCHDQGWTLLTGGGRSLKYRPPRVPEIRPIEYVRPGSSVGSGLIALRPSSGRGMGATVHGTGYGQRTPEPPGQPLRCGLRQARRGSCPWTRARTRPSQAAPAPRAGCVLQGRGCPLRCRSRRRGQYLLEPAVAAELWIISGELRDARNTRAREN